MGVVRTLGSYLDKIGVNFEKGFEEFDMRGQPIPALKDWYDDSDPPIGGAHQ